MLAGDLAVTGAVEELVENLAQQPWISEPVRDEEGLGAEGATAVTTTETLDAVGWRTAGEVSVQLIAPLEIANSMEGAVSMRTEGRCVRGGILDHVYALGTEQSTNNHWSTT